MELNWIDRCIRCVLSGFCSQLQVISWIEAEQIAFTYILLWTGKRNRVLKLLKDGREFRKRSKRCQSLRVLDFGQRFLNPSREFEWKQFWEKKQSPFKSISHRSSENIRRNRRRKMKLLFYLCGCERKGFPFLRQSLGSNCRFAGFLRVFPCD